MNNKLIRDIRSAFEKLPNVEPEIQTVIKSYESALDSLLFIEREKEMRIKFPDIWKLQQGQAKTTIGLLENQLIDLGSKNNIDIAQIIKNHKETNLNLKDFQGLV